MASTLEHARQVEAKAKQAVMAAEAEAGEARAALAAAQQARADAPPAPPSEEATQRAQQLDAAVREADTRRIRADLALPRARRALEEAAARTSRLAPHTATLAKLDRANEMVRARDVAITDAGVGFYTKLAELVSDLDTAIAAAEKVWSALPADARTDLDLPRSLAHFGGVGPAHPRLLALVEAAVAQRLGGYPPNSAEGRAKLAEVRAS